MKSNRIIWKKYRIGDICFVKNGTAPPTKIKKYWQNGTIPFLVIGNMTKKREIEKRFINELFLKDRPELKNLLSAGVCIAGINSFVVHWKEENAFINGVIYLIQPLDIQFLNPKFLYFWLIKNKKLIEAQAFYIQVRWKRLDMDRFKQIEIQIPSLKIQNKIVDYLEKEKKIKQLLENLIDINKKLVENNNALTFNAIGKES